MSLQFLISCFYFFLPAYFANMTPPLIARVKFLAFLGRPVDNNKKIGGKEIFGSHKTWRGVIFAFLVGFSTALLQRFLYNFQFFKKISLIQYDNLNIFVFASLISLGVILGDLGLSFIKRRLKLKPGAPFLPWDQTNYVIGNSIILGPVYKINWQVWLSLFVLTFFLHIIGNYLGYLLGLHKAKL